MRKARCLRAYESLARKDHGRCSLCQLPIWPGDPYRAEVWVYKNKIRVKKFHNGCPVDPDFNYAQRPAEATTRPNQTRKKLAKAA